MSIKVKSNRMGILTIEHDSCVDESNSMIVVS